MSVMLYVEHAASAFERAIAAGAKEVRPLVNQFYCDRSGTVEDPFGYQWTIPTSIEDVPLDEMLHRMNTMEVSGASG